MADKIHREAATAGVIGPTGDLGISIREIENLHLWSIQPDRNQDLPAFGQAIFAEVPRPGEMLGNNSLRLIYLWPHKAYLLSTESALPGPSDDFNSMVTDISHGFCELSLTGNCLLEFLNSYTSANLMDAGIANSRNLRCLLGQYQVILWWDEITNIRILVDRSYAHSFCGYLENLSLRWKATSM
jgi:hypothetical protein